MRESITDPVSIAVDGDVASPAVRAGIRQIQRRLRSDSAFGPARTELAPERNFALVSVPIAGDSRRPGAYRAIDRLRRQYVPRSFARGKTTVLVGGDTAHQADYFAMVDRWLPIAIAAVLALTLVLLTAVFRSVVLALQAVAFNLLSVGAAYGLLVLVFVNGIGNELHGFEQVDTVVAWVPLFLFSVLFGLSMDHNVFLLGRIREHYAAAGDHTGAISFGIGSTARLITGAALIIVSVFAGLALSDLVMFQRAGLGLAVALLVDGLSSAPCSCAPACSCPAGGPGGCHAGSRGCPGSGASTRDRAIPPRALSRRREAADPGGRAPRRRPRGGPGGAGAARDPSRKRAARGRLTARVHAAFPFVLRHSTSPPVASRSGTCRAWAQTSPPGEARSIRIVRPRCRRAAAASDALPSRRPAARAALTALCERAGLSDPARVHQLERSRISSATRSIASGSTGPASSREASGAAVMSSTGDRAVSSFPAGSDQALPEKKSGCGSGRPPDVSVQAQWHAFVANVTTPGRGA